MGNARPGTPARATAWSLAAGLLLAAGCTTAAAPGRPPAPAPGGSPPTSAAPGDHTPSGYGPEDGPAAGGANGMATAPPAGLNDSNMIRVDPHDYLQPAGRITKRIGSPKPDVGVGGVFRVRCNVSRMAALDPIVNPGAPTSPHLHTFFGNPGIVSDLTYDHLRSTAADNRCQNNPDDGSAYWVPTLVDPYENGEGFGAGYGKPVPVQDLEIYYMGNRSANVAAFPPGFAMVAGTPQRGPDSPDAGRFYSWRCNQGERVTGDSPPPCAGGGSNTLRLAVDFPSCWNGRVPNLTALGPNGQPDFSSHMTYPAGGRCPASHPTTVPRLKMNIDYYLPAGTDTTRLRLTSDRYDPSRPGGYSAHADFFNGWDPAGLDALMNSCLRPVLDCG